MISRVAEHLQRQEGYSEAQSFILAVNTVRAWGGSLDEWDRLKSKGNKNRTRAIVEADTALRRGTGAKASPEEQQRLVNRLAHRKVLAEGILVGLDGDRPGPAVANARTLAEGGTTLAVKAPAPSEEQIAEARARLAAEIETADTVIRTSGLHVVAAKARKVNEGKLSKAARKALPKGAYVFPDRAPEPGAYPIHDEGHARSALGRVAQHGTAAEKARVRAAVKARYPHLIAEAALAEAGTTADTGTDVANPPKQDKPKPKARGGNKAAKKAKGRDEKRDAGSAQDKAEFERLHPRMAAGRVGGGMWIKKGEGMQGQASPEVQQLQQRLADLGYASGAKDGRFGDLTDRAVKRFQQDFGLSPTGKVDAATVEVLRNPVRPKVDEDDGNGAGGATRASGGSGGDTGGYGTEGARDSQGRREQKRDEADGDGKGKGKGRGGKDGPAEDEDGFNWREQGNGKRGVTLADGSKKVVSGEQFDDLKRRGMIDWDQTEKLKGDDPKGGDGRDRDSGGDREGGGSGGRDGGSDGGERGEGEGSKGGEGLRQGEGMEGKPSPTVRALQRILSELGLDLGDGGVDGRFGPDTEAAVKTMQKRYGLEADGIVGPKTRKLMARLARRKKRENDAQEPKAPSNTIKEAVVETDERSDLERIADGEEPLEEVKSSAYPGLERKKGGPDNWVEAAGGLPSYIERIAKHLHYEQGYTISRAIASAVNTVKRWAAGGPATQGGKGKVTAATQAKAAKALASWESKKARSKGKSLKETTVDRIAETKKALAEATSNAERIRLRARLDVLEQRLTEAEGKGSGKPWAKGKDDDKHEGMKRCPSCGMKNAKGKTKCFKCKGDLRKKGDAKLSEASSVSAQQALDAEVKMATRRTENQTWSGPVGRMIAAPTEQPDWSEEALAHYSLGELATMISNEWNGVSFAARPYLDAMGALTDVSQYGHERAAWVIEHFLRHAESWSGSAAAAVKKELRRRWQAFKNDQAR